MASRSVEKRRKRLVFLGKCVISPCTPWGRELRQPAADASRTTRRIQHKNVQNHYAGSTVASLLRNELRIFKNNYPQTYPKAENMLVTTNYSYPAREHAARAQRNNAPDREVLGRCSQAWPGTREIGISRFRAGEFRPLEVLSDHP